MAELKCEYQDCPAVYKGTMTECISQMGFHIGANHAPAPVPALASAGATVAAVKPEEKERKTDRQKMKPPVFTESETRDEFGRKNQEFKTYSSRAKLKPEEMSEDLYYACETPLKRRLRASGVVDKEDIQKTKFEALLEEMERICTPKANRLIERDLFSRLEQGEDESITSFESRVRARALQCEFNCCKAECKDNCLTHLKCGFNREEDKIIIQILCKMKDKTLQKKLWAENDHHEDLPKVLATIRASEAADERQAALGTESGSAISKMKCHQCGKLGHSQKNCKGREEKSSSKCGFCGGSGKCKMRKCKAYNIKCNSCNLWGHYKSFCTDFTKSRARKTRDITAVSQVEDDVVEANHIHLNNMRTEQVYRKTTNKAQDRMDVNKVVTNGSRRADVTGGDVDDMMKNEVVNNQANRGDVTN